MNTGTDERRADAGNEREGQIKRGVAMTSESSFSTAPAGLAWPCSRAIMPSSALSAMRKISVTGNTKSGRRD